ncbi:MarR family winged helix-turn-helix transcriptional regulator [Tenacibaculum salmonis]|uniref:MarR family winged helix-turn-helix transcriptional regulator n=1 Tax=Tenacibaculum sp. P3-BQ1 TaxID=3232310 RepID=UPI0034DEEEE5
MAGIFMEESIFNPTQQEKDISSKIVVGLERISEVFKILLWEKAKLIGLSPIQIQILIFINFHKNELCKVSHLAKEFNVTKPTISDAIRVLNNKKLIIKDFSDTDSRSYTILLSDYGSKIITETSNFANPLKDKVNSLTNLEKEELFTSLNKVIFKLNRSGILTIQRTCYSCSFYEKTQNSNYCHLLKQELTAGQIRLDCPEHNQKE